MVVEFKNDLSVVIKSNKMKMNNKLVNPHCVLWI